ncbi:hypothetical protein KAF25_011031 [Fusarium avenaceum]|uniref:Uncharacterized protein n=1 Tax=Fusarium avenaceum TaxID=40199 RepID=A0A9P7H1W3_9HYPO|nr:hypothetical protein KAF25_011031 [Fusarium avenaceum]
MTKLDEQIWIKYALGIQSWSGKNGQPDPKAVYFIASAVTLGPAAGSFVPDENMNNALYYLCDSLIANTSPVYNPGGAGSYFNSVYKYMNSVELKKNHDQGLQQQLDDAKAKFDEVDEEYYTKQNKAIERWGNDRFSGEKAGVSFPSWVNSNAQGLLQLQEEKSDRAEVVSQIRLRMFGPEAATLNKQKNDLVQARDKAVFTNGLSMKTTLNQINPSDYEKYYKATQNGTVGDLPALKVNGTFNRPAYTITNGTYKVLMDQWARVPMDAEDEFEYTIKYSELEETSWTKLGHRDAGIEFGWGFLRFRIGGSKEWKESEITKKSGSFEIQLSAQRAALVDVRPGAWNVERFRQTYPGVDKDIGMAKNAVQPTQLFLASRVKIRVKFTGEMEKEFDKLAKDAKDGKLGISLLGFSIGPSGGTTDEETSHTSSLVKEDGWYKMEPTLVIGGCSMLGVIGNKLDVE